MEKRKRRESEGRKNTQWKTNETKVTVRSKEEIEGTEVKCENKSNDECQPFKLNNWFRR